MRRSVVATGTLLQLIAAWSLAGTTTPPPPTLPAPAKACTAAEYRQFDFWLGDWAVAGPKGNPAGTNHITLEHDGCVLAEHWNGAKGGTGSSFNVYDATDRRWHQVWVDSQGTLLQLAGGIVDGRMVLEGPGVGPKGETIVNRIAWEKLPDGRVRQTWTVSSDGGTSWSTAFDGFYSKR
ncbi:MAG TPA: hypothetical protein VMR65_05505 [Candidatus Sulfotelmatobacter sp.]|jgi:hypothetical protein|nr:hypothetical protein [Candidatus Sulfotelmatobacter sp.]